MLPETRLAFDISVYRHTPHEIRRAASDLAALTREASSRNHERVSYVEYVQGPDGHIYCPNYSLTQDVSNLFKKDPITQALVDRMLTTSQPFVCVWLSPQDISQGWPETRINLYFSLPQAQRAFAKNYAISCQMSSAECLHLANTSLLPLLSSPAQPFSSPDTLRTTPLFFNLPPNMTFVDFGKLLIPLPWAWKFIKSGQADQKARQAYQAALTIVEKHRSSILNATTTNDQLRVGAQMEQAMAKQGHTIRIAGSGCGASNSELLGKLMFGNQDVELKPGQTVSTKEVFCKNCPLCGHEIKARIRPGFACPQCREVYKGVC